MSALEKIEREARRLRILQTLAKAAGYSTNEEVIRMSIEADYGLSASHDMLRSDLGWLAEQGLLDLEIIGTDIQVATITTRGADVANGIVRTPGIKHPRPV